MVLLKSKSLKEFFEVNVLFLNLEPQVGHDSFEFVLKLDVSLREVFKVSLENIMKKKLIP